MSRRVQSWVTLVVAVVLTLLSGLSPATTTTASESTFIYDAPAVVHVAGHASLARLAGSQHLSGPQEGSAPRSPSAPGASTSRFARSVATKSVPLYRAVSAGERADLAVGNGFRAGVNSYEGKLFATTPQDAASSGESDGVGDGAVTASWSAG